VLIYGLSHYFNRRFGRVDTHDMTVSFGGIGGALVRFGLVHAPIIGLVFGGWLTPQTAALPAALLTLLLFGWYWKRADESLPFYQSDIFYAGLLTGAMVWIMYFFA